MAISQAYRRGFQRALQAAAELAFQRKIVCENAAEGYVKDERYKEGYWAESETCAAREAQYIWEEILKLKPAQDQSGD